MSHCKENDKSCRVCSEKMEYWNDSNGLFSDYWRCPNGHYTYEILREINGIIHSREEILFGAEYPILRIIQPDNRWELRIIQKIWTIKGGFAKGGDEIAVTKVIDIVPFEINTDLEIVKKKIDLYITFS